MTWPFENDTTRFVNKLAKRSLQSEKRRNIMVIISVALAAFLISFGGGLAASLVQMQTDQVADTYEAVYRNVSEQNMQTLKDQPEIARVGQYYLVGEETSTKGFSGSFVYADDAMLYIGRQQMRLLSGKPPVEANEIMVSKSWLRKHAPGAKPGDSVSLLTDSFQGEYRISGTMDTATVAGTQTYSFIISKKLLLQHPDYEPSGYRAYVHLKNDTDMTGQQIQAYCDGLAGQYGFAAPAYNSQYLSWAASNTSVKSVVLIGVLAAIVLIGGGVVIQSIFRISIIDKVKSFGQLRTLGATKKQIKRIVRKEGWRLGWLGVLIGTPFGIGIPLLIAPSAPSPVHCGVIIFASVLICFLMIAISIKKPVKMAAEVSPIEAVRFTGQPQGRSHQRQTCKKLTPFSLGKMNFSRDKKKTGGIVLSLSIGGILLLCASTLLLIYSPRELAKKQFPHGEYKVYISSQNDTSNVLHSGNPLSEELRQQILALDGVKEVVATRQSTGADFTADDYSGGGMADMITPDNALAITDALTQGTMPADAHSILVADVYKEFQIGQSIQLSVGNASCTATVCGKFNLSKITAGQGHKNLQLDGAMAYLPNELFKQLLPGVENFDYSWDIVSEPAKSTTVNAGLLQLANSHAEIGLDAVQDLVAYYEAVYTVPFHMLQGIALFIALFGVINLINTTLSNQIARQRETSILRSVGLSKKQLYQMIALEGMGYVLSSIVVTLLAGLPLAYGIHHQISATAYGAPTPFKFPFLYMALYCLLLLVIEFFLSTWTIRKQKKQSLIEQLRALE